MYFIKSVFCLYFSIIKYNCPEVHSSPFYYHVCQRHNSALHKKFFLNNNKIIITDALKKYICKNMKVRLLVYFQIQVGKFLKLCKHKKLFIYFIFNGVFLFIYVIKLLEEKVAYLKGSVRHLIYRTFSFPS